MGSGRTETGQVVYHHADIHAKINHLVDVGEDLSTSLSISTTLSTGNKQDLRAFFGPPHGP